MKKALFIVFLLFQVAAFAQNADEGFNWCEDKKKSQSLWTFIDDEMKKESVEAYKTVRKPIQELYAYCPEVNEGLYIYGKKAYTKLADELANGQVDEATLQNFRDTSLFMFKKRMELWPEDDYDTWLNQLGYYELRFRQPYAKTKEDWDEIYNTYKQIHEANKNEIYPYNANILFSLSCEQKNQGNLNEEDILNLYATLEGYYNEHTSTETKLTKNWKRYWPEIEKTLERCVQFDCGLVKKVLEPKYRETNDFGLAKNMWTIMRDDKCTDEPLFSELTELILEKEPSAALYDYYGDLQFKQDNFQAAIENYEKAVELENNASEKAALMMRIAGIYQSKMGSRSAARTWYRKAAANGRTDAYEEIGDMYYGSFDECKQGNPVADRFVMIAAYDMYQKAGASSKAAQAKQQFPGKTDIFTYTQYKEGETYNTGCWVNENVVLQPR